VAVIPYPDPQPAEVLPAAPPAGAGELMHTLDDVVRVARAFAASGMFPDAQAAEQAFVKLLAGRELGLGPMQAMTQIHVVKGKPSMSAALQAALLKRGGRYDFRIVHHDEQRCEIAFYDRGEEVGRSTFSIDDARQAGLLSNNQWRTYPRNMLWARALTNGVRWFCPDVLGGSIYDPDELGGQVVDQAAAPAVPRQGPRGLTPRVVPQEERQPSRHDRQQHGEQGDSGSAAGTPDTPAPEDSAAAYPTAAGDRGGSVDADQGEGHSSVHTGSAPPVSAPATDDSGTAAAPAGGTDAQEASPAPEGAAARPASSEAAAENPAPAVGGGPPPPPRPRGGGGGGGGGGGPRTPPPRPGRRPPRRRPARSGTRAWRGCARSRTRSASSSARCSCASA
jgi:hypothetical protein